MPAHRPFFVVRNPATGQLRKVGYASVEDGMQQVLLTNGSVEAALNFPEAVTLSAATPEVQHRKGTICTASTF